jgi:hypothetical protein
MALEIASVGSAIVAVGALGTASFGLLDATKALGGGISVVGWKQVAASLQPFQTALSDGNVDWTTTIRANWINGLPKDDQKAAAKSLIRLGLSPANAATLAPAGRVDPVRLAAVMTAIDAGLDAGFERGDQRYRSAARMAAGVIAIALSIVLVLLFPGLVGGTPPRNFFKAILIGLVAVPTAPIAKDLASALSTAAAAFKAARV